MVSESESDGKLAPSRRDPSLKQPKHPKYIKPRAKSEHNDTVTQPADAPNQQPQPLTANTVRTTDLPPFTKVNAKWRNVFIPSLYNALFQSEAPFKDFVLSAPKFINIVQNLVDHVYPEVDYTVKRDDAIHLLVRSNSLSLCSAQYLLSKAYNHINEKRSSLGGDAVAVVAKHLKELGYEVEDAKLWCRWAKRVDGPMFFKIPTPQTCPIDTKHKDYIVSIPPIFSSV